MVKEQREEKINFQFSKFKKFNDVLSQVLLCVENLEIIECKLSSKMFPSNKTNFEASATISSKPYGGLIGRNVNRHIVVIAGVGCTASSIVIRPFLLQSYEVFLTDTSEEFTLEK